MVEYYDAITGVTLSNFIDKKLIKIWDGIKDGKLKEKNEDRVYLVDGREGSGKSFWTFQQAKYLDPTFSVKDIHFLPEKFLEALRTAPPGKVIVFDEAFKGLSSKGSRSKINKAIVEALMESRKRGLIIFIVLPTFFLLEIYAAVFRSEALFHIYKLKKTTGSGERRRAFKIYNYNKKMQLYLRGKNKYFSYSYPRIRMAKGMFIVSTREDKQKVPYITFELEEYNKKAAEAFSNFGEKEEKESDKFQEAYYNAIRVLVDNLGSMGKAAKALTEYGNPISQVRISQIYSEKGWKIGQKP